jgi:hypothetical protein
MLLYMGIGMAHAQRSTVHALSVLPATSAVAAASSD